MGSEESWPSGEVGPCSVKWGAAGLQGAGGRFRFRSIFPSAAQALGCRPCGSRSSARPQHVQWRADSPPASPSTSSLVLWFLVLGSQPWGQAAGAGRMLWTHSVLPPGPKLLLCPRFGGGGQEAGTWKVGSHLLPQPVTSTGNRCYWPIKAPACSPPAWPQCVLYGGQRARPGVSFLFCGLHCPPAKQV